MIHSFQDASFRDQETGLYSQAYFMEIFYREWHRVVRENQALSLLIMQPNLNIVEPEALKEFITLGHLLEENTWRTTDLVSRYQNNEFIIGLFNLDPSGTTMVIDRISSAVSQHSNGQTRNAFIGGVNICPDRQMDINGLFEQVKSITSTATIKTRSKSDKLSYELRQFTLN